MAHRIEVVKKVPDTRAEVRKRQIHSAGITDESGRVLGMMPHPERGIRFTQLPDWTLRKEKLKRSGNEIPNEYSGIQILKNGVDYFD